MATAEGFLSGRDGVRLFHRQWAVSDPKAICLLVHGIAEHSGRYAHVAEALNQRGFSVWAQDHRGHGRSEGRRGDCRSLEMFVEDLNPPLHQIRSNPPSLPLFLIGHSLGGLIALAYAVRYPGGIRAVAVSSPALKLAHETPPLKVAVVSGIARLFPQIHFQNGVNPHLLCHDPAVVKAYQQDPLVHRVITARCAVALRDAMRKSLDLAERLKIPCLIQQAGSDEVCDPNAAARFAQSADSGSVNFRLYEGLYHELYNEPQKGRVLQDLCRWMEETLK